jgi:hypothetical protein
MKHGIQKTSILEVIMREYALTQAQPALSTAFIPLAVQCFRTALVRRQIRKALRDGGPCAAFGLTSTDLSRLLALPLSCDLSMEMERLSFLIAHDQSGHPEAATA